MSYNYLSHLVAERLLLSAPDVDISTALSIMPLTISESLCYFICRTSLTPKYLHAIIEGMDLNPVFTSPTAFQPASTGGELALFAQAGISLVHGWLADPSSPEYSALTRARDYDAATDVIVAADVLTRGRLVLDDALSEPSGSGSAGPSGSSSAGPSGSSGHTGGLSAEDRQKVEDGRLTSYEAEQDAKLMLYGSYCIKGLARCYAFAADLPWALYARWLSRWVSALLDPSVS